jgi:hypothetical protein
MRHFLLAGSFAFAMFSSPTLFAQSRSNWFWPSVQVEKKFFGDLTVSVNGEGRINEGYSNLSGFFGEFEAKWDFNKYLAVSGNYRLGGRQTDVLDYVKGQRVTLFVYGKVKFDKFSIHNRAGLLRQYVESRETPRDYFRNKLTVKGILTKKLNPFVYVEFFHRLDTEPTKTDEWRYAGGLEYDITKQHGLEARYIFCKEVNVKTPDVRDVWALSYTYKIKSKKKAPKEPKQN